MGCRRLACDFLKQELSGIGQELTEIFFLTAITSNGPAISSNALASERFFKQELSGIGQELTEIIF